MLRIAHHIEIMYSRLDLQIYMHLLHLLLQVLILLPFQSLFLLIYLHYRNCFLYYLLVIVAFEVLHFQFLFYILVHYLVSAYMQVMSAQLCYLILSVFRMLYLMLPPVFHFVCLFIIYRSFPTIPYVYFFIWWLVVIACKLLVYIPFSIV